MNYNEVPKYIFSSILACIGAYGFINNIDLWQLWLAVSVGFLVISKLTDF